MAKKLKRAFTIVELVIVIAVIAILAAVLIPTFTTLIDKANQSADTSNVKNMNSILAMDETTNGKPKTMDDAVKVIREGGYDLEKLTPTGRGYDIVWDQDANRLLMVNGNEVIFGETEKNANEKHLWVVVDSVEKIAATGYSVYLTDVFKGTVEAKQGVDVGSNEDITTVTYNPTEKQDVKIRTNGGALEVNAAAATVSHYDAAASVDIQAVADHSYHEYGTVNQIDVTVGRVVLESGSATKTVYVKGEGVKVEWKEDSKPQEVGISTEVDDTKVQLPSGSDVPVKEVDEAVSSLFAGGLGTAGSPYLIADKSAFEVIRTNLQADMQAGIEYHFKLIEDITITEQDEAVKKLSNGDFALMLYLCGTFDGNGHNLNWKYFDGNATATTWFSFIYYMKATEATQESKIENLNVYISSYDSAIYFTLVANTGKGFGSGIDEGQYVYQNINFYNADSNTLKFPGNNHGLLGGFAAGNITVKDCNSYVNALSDGVNGVWFGSMQFISYDVYFENVNNYGSYTGSSLGYFFGNTSYILDDSYSSHDGSISFTLDEINEHVKVIDCYNEGVIFKTEGEKKFYLFGSTNIANTAWETFSDDLMKSFNKGTGISTYLASSGNLQYSIEDGKIKVVNNSIEIVSVQIVYSTMYKDSQGIHGGFSLNVNITDDLSSQYYAKFATTVDGDVSDYDEVVATISKEESSNGVEYFICKKGEEYFYVFNNLAEHLSSNVLDDVELYSVNIKIFGFNSSGTLIDYVDVA